MKLFTVGCALGIPALAECSFGGHLRDASNSTARNATNITALLRNSDEPIYVPSIGVYMNGYDAVTYSPFGNNEKQPIFESSYSQGMVTPDYMYKVPDGIAISHTMHCSLEAATKTVTGEESYKKSIETSVSVEASGGFIDDFKFSGSTTFKDMASKESSSEDIYMMSSVQCENFVIHTLKDSPPPLRLGFLTRLLRVANKEEDAEGLLKTYGTSYLAKGTLGSKYIRGYKLKKRSFQELESSSLGVKASASASLLGFTGAISAQTDVEKSAAKSFNEKSESIQSSTIGARIPSVGNPEKLMETWEANSAKSKDLGIISNVVLAPIYELVSTARLEGINKDCERHGLGLFTRESLEHAQSQIRQAMIKYCDFQFAKCEEGRPDTNLPPPYRYEAIYRQEYGNNGGVEVKPSMKDFVGHLESDGKFRSDMWVKRIDTWWGEDAARNEVLIGIATTLTDETLREKYQPMGQAQGRHCPIHFQQNDELLEVTYWTGTWVDRVEVKFSRDGHEVTEFCGGKGGGKSPPTVIQKPDKLIGFYGRAGARVDKIGAVLAKAVLK